VKPFHFFSLFLFLHVPPPSDPARDQSPHTTQQQQQLLTLCCVPLKHCLKSSHAFSSFCVVCLTFQQPEEAVMGRLAPLSEEPINEENEGNNNNSKKCLQSWRNWNWIKTHFSLVFNKKSNLKILLSVLGCPLFPLPVHHLSPLNEASPSLLSLSFFLSEF